MKSTSLTLLLLLAPTLARPADGVTISPRPAPAKTGAATTRAAVLRGLARGATFTSGGRAFQIVGARALHRAPHETEAAALARVGAGATDVVERKGRFVLVRDAGRAASAVMPAAGGALPVALDVKSGRLGVVMGVVNVKLRPGADAAALAREHGLTLQSQAPRLGMAFLRVPEGKDVAAAAAALAGDPAVESAEPDVLVNPMTPR